MRVDDGNVNTNGLDLDNGLDWAVLLAYSFSALSVWLRRVCYPRWLDCLVGL
jgi:hypothetical protein